MKKLGQIIIASIVAIILIPGAITAVVGNNMELDKYELLDEKKQESIEGEQLSQERLIGIVAKEIPIEHHEEAIKSQVVMARSYIALGKGQEKAYMTIDEMKEIWGNNYRKNYTKIQKAVEDTKNLILTYNNEPIQAVYHMQSAGITQDPMEVLGLEIPYIESVESRWDEKSIDLLKEKTYSQEDISNRVNQKLGEPILEAYDLEAQIQIIERTKGGYVKSIQVGSKLMSGEEFKNTLGLRSSCFMIEYQGKQVRIISKGLGHGVGLSQYGANEMAKEGKDYKEILKHYFPKADINYQK
ncbi:MAG: SpoIID/LytB domain-containing protein [Epulopiscium sp.]|nr:SpoIID/LytB domain-containing protein [Candidatus Epulonipiscium sp.]